MNRSIRGIRLILAVATLTLVLAIPAIAQPREGGTNRGSGIRAERQIELMDEKLDLTDAQEAQVRSILEQHRSKAAAWFSENPSATREERLAFHNEHRAALRAEISDVLSEEQGAQLDAVLPATPYGRGMMSGGRAGTGRGDRGFMRGARADRAGRMLFRQLDLSEEQTQQLQAMREAHRQEMTAWLDQNPNATRQERLDFMAQHREEGLEEMKSILTPEQVEKLETLRSQRKEAGPRQGRGRMRL